MIFERGHQRGTSLVVTRSAEGEDARGEGSVGRGRRRPLLLRRCRKLSPVHPSPKRMHVRCLKATVESKGRRMEGGREEERRSQLEVAVFEDERKLHLKKKL